MGFSLSGVYGMLPEAFVSVLGRINEGQGTLVIIAATILGLLVSGWICLPFVKYLVERIRKYHMEVHARIEHKIWLPGTSSWGNFFFRIPLLLIGTEINCFAKIRAKAKLRRYVKVVSVIVPSVWAAYSMVIFTLGNHSTVVSGVDLYIALIPIVLVTISVFVLDVTIITAEGNTTSDRILKSVRIVIALITGYVFTSIPLNHCFSSSVDSYLATKDSQVAYINNERSISIKALEPNEIDFLQAAALKASIDNSQSVINEYKAILANPTASRRAKKEAREKIESINASLSASANSLMDISKTNNARKDSIISKYDSRVETVKLNKARDHIKRHVALWEYASSEPGAAFYFIAIMMIFFLVDSLAVLCSFISESEYDAKLNEWKATLDKAYRDDNYNTPFLPQVINVSRDEVK